jgi:Zn-finger nucleic acid-binding protein
MRCPRDQAELTTKTYEGGVDVDECPTCAGVFLDHGELEAIQAAVEKDHHHEHADAAAPAGVDEVRGALDAPVDCPRCGKRMERRRYGLGSMTVIDECAEGCGMWLDGGELAELERLYETSQDEVRIPLTWRLWARIKGALVRRK